ncbi:hypothetical protein GCM10017778_28950 [Streptomyces vinaceus]|nr:hypothetical protein GCM10017778_28950 [Streptomyces vinaceus]
MSAAREPSAPAESVGRYGPADIRDHFPWTDSTLPMLWRDPDDTSDMEDPIEPTDSADPIEPMDRALPTDPTDSTDPTEPIDRKESLDHRENGERPTGREEERVMGPVCREKARPTRHHT